MNADQIIEKMEDENESNPVEVDDQIIPKDHFIPREYQVEMLESARDKNIIACLGTGTGKTFIAVMLIKEMSYGVQAAFTDGGKRTIFLVPTVPLVTQQMNVLKDHTDLKVKEYYGALGLDFWSKEQWHKEFQESQVLVMTAEIFRVILQHGFLSLSQVNLIVFDECHRAVGSHPYAEIMRCFDTCPPEQRPKILGLTASILNGKCKPHQVEKNIQKLELTLMGVASVARNLLAYNKFGTKPNELIIYYSGLDVNVAIPEFKWLVDSMRAIVNQCNICTTETDLMKKLRKYVTETYEAFNILGPWCALTIAKQFSAEITSSLGNADLDEAQRKLCDNTKESLDMIAALILSILPETEEMMLLGISPKLKQLLQILIAGHTWLQKNNHLDICSVIFVQKRITAYILYQWLHMVSMIVPEYNFIKCNFVVGHGAQSIDELKGLEMATKKQKDVINSFHEKEYNLIIATSVIEEGLDVPHCNLVIRFDMPLDYRAYIQSKGRARSRKAFYVMMVSEHEKQKFSEDILDYKAIEKILSKMCIDRLLPLEEEIIEHFDADTLLPPYMPLKEDGAPRITLSSAISLINRYCTLLPSDAFTRLRPNYLVKDAPGSLYQCHLNLPMNSAIKEVILGEPMRTKRTAVMAAALKACQRLHECGELDESLLPLRQDTANFSDEDDEEEDEASNVGKKGTKKRRTYYNKQVADALSGNPPSTTTECYVYMLVVKLVDPLPNLEFNIVNDPLMTSRRFGLLTTKKIHAIESFPLFTHAGQVEVKIELVAIGVTCSKEELHLVQLFHRKLFEDVLKLAKKQIFDPDQSGCSYYVVPINQCEGTEAAPCHIDWGFLKETALKYESFSTQRKRKFVFQRENYLDTVLISSYRPYGDQQVYYVKEIHDDLTPLSLLPDHNITFEGYYFARYNAVVKTKEQSLVRVSHVKNPALLFPPYMFSSRQKLRRGTATKSKQPRQVQYMIPELCDIHPFTASLWFKALTMPCILHRLNSLLLVEELRVATILAFGVGKVNLDGKFHWPPFVIKEADQQQEAHVSTDRVDQIDFGQLTICSETFCLDKRAVIPLSAAQNLNTFSGPTLDNLLTAMTTKNAADIFDLERLETIGDSFLKYASSEYMYFTYPTHCEGKLTSLKMKEISNANLVKLAKARKIPDMMASAKFEPTVNFLAPGYVVPENVEKALAESGLPERYWNIYKLPSDLSTVTEEQLKTHINYLKAMKEKAVDAPDEAVFDSEHFLPYKPLRVQSISDKAVADVVEGLIGAYLISGGTEVALLFMSWLGLRVMKDCYKDEIRSGILKPGNVAIYERFKPFEDTKPPLLPADSGVALKLLKGLVSDVEEILNYQFQNKAYLMQAFVHASFFFDQLIFDCYERLEFLGDALLDYLVTRFLYEDSENYNPGDLTDIRASLVNNSLLASLAVKCGFHKKLKHKCPDLFRTMNRFVEKELHVTKEELDKCLQMEEDECELEEEIEVPKALADVFEALVGAIYLDSNKSLDVVWKVIYTLMGREIETFKNHPPKDAVRLLIEMYPEKLNLRYSDPVAISGRKVKVVIEVNGRVFYGIGTNKKGAKKAACKKALRVLKAEQRRANQFVPL